MIKRILLSLPLWLGYTVVSLVLDLIGIVILLPLSLGHSAILRYSKVYKAPRADGKPALVFAWKGSWLTWLWGNEEDGVNGAAWWANRTIGWPLWLRMYVWSALRNPSNNIRFIPVINPVIDPTRIRYIRRTSSSGVSQVTVTWQGPFAGLLYVFQFRGQVYRFWWGWKLKPEDAGGVSDADMRKPRCGFALQFKRIG